MERITLGDLTIEVVQKGIKNVHLSVYPPAGRVRISAPLHMRPETIRLFAVSKLDWIKRQQRKLREQDRESERDYLDRESHYVFGRRRLLKVIEREGSPRIEIKNRVLILQARPGSSAETRAAAVEEWYRGLLREAVPPLIAQWEPAIGVKVARFFVQRMKTKWGSCNHRAATLRFNTELAKKPPECLEYLVVHEMVHILEPTHNARFIALMDRLMPQWRHRRDVLNRLPLRHERWGY